MFENEYDRLVYFAGCALSRDVWSPTNPKYEEKAKAAWEQAMVMEKMMPKDRNFNLKERD